jgi:hypothetical protein
VSRCASKPFYIIRDWQQFCARLAKMLHCPAMADDVEKAVRELRRERNKLRKIVKIYRPANRDGGTK